MSMTCNNCGKKVDLLTDKHVCEDCDPAWKHTKLLLKYGLKDNYPVYQYWKRLQVKQVPYYKELVAFVALHKLINVRQFYYHCVQSIDPALKLTVTTGVESVRAYQKIDNIVVNARMGGLIPMDSIADDSDLEGKSQWPIPIEEYLEAYVDHYRSNWFEKQKVYVEVWVEKRAMSKIFKNFCDPLGVLVSVSGKYPSLAQVSSAIERFKEQGKEKNVILYFGDLDPTGRDMVRYLREQFPILGLNNVDIIEVAVNPSDISTYNLATLPLKQGDKRIQWYLQTYKITYGVELDAIDPGDLKNIFITELVNHLDIGEIEAKKNIDEAEKIRILDILKKAKGEELNETTS